MPFFFSGIVLLAASIAMDGIGLFFCWGWFVMPALHVEAITVLQATGLSLTVSAVRFRKVRKPPGSPGWSASEMLDHDLAAIAEALLIYFCAFLVHLFQ
jgi:hypothetical protein